MDFLEWISSYFDSKFPRIVPTVSVDSKLALVQIIALRQTGNKSFSDAVLGSLVTHMTCVTWSR